MQIARRSRAAAIAGLPSQEEVFSTGEQWKAAMIEKGWA
jgi:hypothetical protein